MAGLGSNKKRSNSGSQRVSRFSEVLGAAQENTQTSGYPESQLSEQPDTQPVEDLSSQTSASTKTQVAGYPDIQQPAQSDIQPIEHLSNPKSTSSKTQVSNHLETQLYKNSGSQIPGYPDIQLPENSTTQTAKKSKEKDKLAKRENPDYTQTTFRIPKKLSRQINRVLMDLADEGVEVDRSDLVEELANAFIRLADEVGAVEALERIKNLGTQMNE